MYYAWISMQVLLLWVWLTFSSGTCHLFFLTTCMACFSHNLLWMNIRTYEYELYVVPCMWTMDYLLWLHVHTILLTKTSEFCLNKTRSILASTTLHPTSRSVGREPESLVISSQVANRGGTGVNDQALEENPVFITFSFEVVRIYSNVIKSVHVYNIILVCIMCHSLVLLHYFPQCTLNSYIIHFHRKQTFL